MTCPGGARCQGRSCFPGLSQLWDVFLPSWAQVSYFGSEDRKFLETTEWVSPRGTDHHRESFRRKSGKHGKSAISVVVTARAGCCQHVGWKLLFHLVRSVAETSSRPLCAPSSKRHGTWDRRWKEGWAQGAGPWWPQEGRLPLERSGRATPGNFGGRPAWWLHFHYSEGSLSL